MTDHEWSNKLWAHGQVNCNISMAHIYPTDIIDNKQPVAMHANFGTSP